MLVWSCSLANSTSALVHGSTLPQQVWVVFFIAYLGLFLIKFGGMIKIITLYQLLGYKTPELIVESESIFSYDYYDLTSILQSSNLVIVEERTHSRALEKQSSCVPI
jgi:hypothetical protein